MSRSARSSASCFHLRSSSTVKRASSVSISLAQSSHSQIPLLAARRSSGVRRVHIACRRARAAAVICAASPTLTDLFSSKAGPEVGRRHCGLEQWWPARLARVRIVAAGNSSRFVMPKSKCGSERQTNLRSKIDILTTLPREASCFGSGMARQQQPQKQNPAENRRGLSTV